MRRQWNGAAVSAQRTLDVIKFAFKNLGRQVFVACRISVIHSKKLLQSIQGFNISDSLQNKRCAQAGGTWRAVVPANILLLGKIT